MKAHVRMHNGTPTVFLDGKPCYASFHLVGHQAHPDGLLPTQPIIREYARAGVHLYSTDVVSREWRGPLEDDPSPYDFSLVESRFRRFLEVDPGAHFLLRMGFETRWQPNNWWNTRYPEECMVTSDGKLQTQSLASRLWRGQVNDFLRAFIRHLREINLYDRVIAYQIAAGTCGEWIESWSSMGNVTLDYSDPMKRHFRAWLRERYGGNASALRSAWGNEKADFGSAEVPSADRQFATSHGLFRDPVKERDIIDFYDCLAETAAEDLLEFCRTVKEATDGDKLTGAFFGYLMEIAWNNNFFVSEVTDPEVFESSGYSTYQRSGHLGLPRLLRSPDIDFFVSPYSYVFRGLGGDGLPMQPGESLRHHGKIYLMEEDTRMHNNFDPRGRMHPPETTMAIYRRNFAQAVTHGLGITWMHDCGMKDFPENERPYYDFLRRSQQIGNWAVGLDRTPAAEVAVFLDTESFYYQSLKNSIDVPLIFQQKVIGLNRFGAPHDVYLLDDLLNGIRGNAPDGARNAPAAAALAEYKLYVFLNPWRLDARRREALARIVKRPGRTALWLYAPGLIADDVSLENMEDLTGFRFAKTDNPWSPFMHITDFDHPVTRFLTQDLFWGASAQLSPLFHLEDGDARVLGQVVGSLGRCKPGLGIKEIPAEEGGRAASERTTRTNGGTAQNKGRTPESTGRTAESTGGTWRSVYLATPNIPPALLRGIARWAGVHLYSDAGDVLYAAGDLLAVHTVSGGERTFLLPGKVQVVHELFDDTPVARNCSRFEVKLAPASTSLFFAGDRAVLDRLGRTK